MNRFSVFKFYPAMQPLIDLGKNIHDAGRLEPALIELLLMRVSQINGCAFCLDMHSTDTRAAGETEQRLCLLPAWRETKLYSERERIALAWAEELTELASHEALPDALYAQARTVRGSRARRSHPARRRDQQLEPRQHCRAHDRWQLQGCRLRVVVASNRYSPLPLAGEGIGRGKLRPRAGWSQLMNLIFFDVFGFQAAEE